MNLGIESSVVQLVAKLTIVLAGTWLAHAALARQNPRWRMWMWRVTAVGVAALLIATALPPMYELPVLSRPVDGVESPIRDETALAQARKSKNDAIIDAGQNESPPPWKPEAQANESSGAAPPFPPVAQRTLPAGRFEPDSEAGAPSNTTASTSAVAEVGSSADDESAATSGPAPVSGLPAWQVNWWTWGAAAYCVVLAALLLRLVMGTFLANRARHTATPAPNWMQTIARKTTQGDGRRALPVLLTDRFHSPVLIGVRRPTVLLPGSMLQSPSAEQDVRGAIAHEAAHAASGDLLWDRILAVIAAIVWPHPLAWRARAVHRAACERVCDRVAADALGDVPAYKSLLARIALGVCRAPAPAGLAMARRSDVRNRLSALLTCPGVPRLGRRAAVIAASVTVGVIALGVGSLVQKPDDVKVAAAQAPEDETESEFAAAKERADRKESDTVEHADAAPPQQNERPMAVIGGIVVDAAGQPVPNANVTADIAVDLIKTITDSEGRFAFEIPSHRVPRATLLASGPDGMLGFVQISAEIESPDALPPQEIVVEPPRVLPVHVLTRQGEPVAGAQVTVNRLFHAISRTATNDEGRATLAVPRNASIQFVLADAGRAGVDYVLFRRANEPVRDPYRLLHDTSDEITLTLSPTRSLTVHVVDHQGEPLPGAIVSPWQWTLPKKGGMVHFDGLWRKRTGDEGTVEFDNIPLENEGLLRLQAYKERYIAEGTTTFDPHSADTRVSITMLPLVPVSGRVVFADGSPVEGAGVIVSAGGYRTGGFRRETVTAEDGTFRIDAEPDTYCMFVAGKDRWVSSALTKVVRLGEPVAAVELTLQRATRVFGRLTDGNERTPVPGEWVGIYQMDGEQGTDYYKLPVEQQLPNPTGSRRGIDPTIGRNMRTDDAGRFEFFVGPGYYYYMPVRGGIESKRITITDQEEIEVDLHGEAPLRETLTGRVVLKSNPEQGVAEARVTGYPDEVSASYLRATTDAQGNFEGYRSRTGQLVGAISEGGKLGGIVRVEPGADNVVIELSPTATLRGTLVHEDSGQPAAFQEIGANIRIERESGGFTMAFEQNATTDEDGSFQIVGIVPGHLYRLNVVTERGEEGRPRSWRTVGQVTATRAETIDLGELRLRAPYRPPTIEERIARAFANQHELPERLPRTLADAKLALQQVLLVAADPESTAAQQFFQARYDYADGNKGLQDALANYMIVSVAADQSDLLKDRGIEAPDKDGATFAVLNSEGAVAVQAEFAALSRDGELDRARLAEFLNTRRVPLPDAAKELSDAVTKALRQDKRVLVQVSGPGCIPCIYLARHLDAHNELIAKDYVYVKLDSRMPSGSDVIKRLKMPADAGIPWMVILAADGKALVTSDSDEGNIGYPSTESSKAHFRHMLRITRQRLSDEEIDALVAGLER